MGSHEADVIGKRLSQFFSEEFRPLIDESVRKALAGEQNSFEAVQLRQDASAVIWNAILSPIFDGTGSVNRFVAIFEDITQRKRAEEELLRSQKLESLGILAGGVAHDFNNLLTGFFGYISLAKMKGTPPVIAYLEKAEKALDRARGLSQQLLTFSKGGEPVKRIVNLVPLIYESVQFALSGSKVDVIFLIPQDLKAVEADPGQIGQVVENIVINAVEAMQAGGTITVKAWNETFVRDSHWSRAGEYLAMSIIDEGIGIPEEHLSRVFDPFFTTKTKGNGLGLSSSYSIIKKHGGWVDVISEIGEGSTFTFFLPISDMTSIDKKADDESYTYGNSRILVLEDEEIVANVCRDILTALRYEAQFAATGENILKEYSAAMEFGSPYDAVILDLTVKGGMGGEITMERLLVLDPQVKAIASSGYADDPIMANYSLYGFQGVLPKPYRIEELSKALSKLFNKT